MDFSSKEAGSKLFEEAPVGCQEIRVSFKVDAAISEGQKQGMIEMVRKYSPVN